MTLPQFLLGLFAYGAAMLVSCGMFMAAWGGPGAVLWIVCAAVVHYYLLGGQ